MAVGAHGGQASGQLLRVAAYARELGRRMALTETELDALEAASLLHDIGELALPHHVLSPSTEITPEVFEKLKLHPIVAAEIVERIGFPFPVSPLVRAHHERWDGKGYPEGLHGECIPLGARILALAVHLASRVDECILDSLQVRAGSHFDPSLVEMVTSGFDEIDLAVRGAAGASEHLGFETAIASARREECVLSEMTGELGNSLSLHETLSVLDGRLKRLVAYDSLVFYLPGEERLLPAFVSGENTREFCCLEVPFGLGIAGEAAQTRRPMFGANDLPALAVPLLNKEDLTGVLALYRAPADAFSKDDLRVVLAIRTKLTAAVANARRHEHAEQWSVVDPVTCLPNGRALFLRLDSELARCRRNRSKLAVLVCELEGIEPISARLYQSIAIGLRGICREDDCVARQGDRFVLVLSGFGPRDFREKGKLIDAVIHEAAQTTPLAARLGAAFYPEDGGYAEDLLSAAELRLNQRQEFGVALADSSASEAIPK